MKDDRRHPILRFAGFKIKGLSQKASLCTNFAFLISADKLQNSSMFSFGSQAHFVFTHRLRGCLKFTETDLCY